MVILKGGRSFYGGKERKKGSGREESLKEEE
jgi:hypothetical protein